jgi:KR domain
VAKVAAACGTQVVLTISGASSLTAACLVQAELLDARSAYVITGGTGGLGLLFAAWLSGGGARHVALWGRSGRAAGGAEMNHLLCGHAQVRGRCAWVLWHCLLRLHVSQQV